jgi:predicted lipoprotein with Yx(FWY)xxD motif
MRQVRIRLGGLAAVLGAALFLAACGSSSSSSSNASAANSSPNSSQSASPSTGAVAIKTAKGSMGTYLTGASGRALYMWVADSSGKSSCSGECAKAWPPLIAKSTPVASGGANAAELGTITRSDGKKQVTYKGHPLYYFIGDSSAAPTKGQGSNSFGAKWWLVAPSGAVITAGGSSTAGSSSSSSSGSYGGSSSTSSGGGGWG